MAIQRVSTVNYGMVKMNYSDRKKIELSRELRDEKSIASATDLYNLGKEIYEAERLDRLDLSRGCPWAPRTPLGELAVQRYLRGEPKRRLP